MATSRSLSILASLQTTFAVACGASVSPLSAAPKVAIERVAYCTATVTTNDVHSCIHELKGDDWRRRGFSYRLTYRDGRMVLFEQLTGWGELVDDSMNFCARAEYEYQTDKLVRVRCFDQGGTTRGGTLFDGRWARWIDSWDRPRRRSEDDVTGLHRTFDAAGRVASYKFIDADGKPVPDESGVFEVHLGLDAKGTTIRRSYHGKDGEPVKGEAGYHRMECESAAFGVCKVERFFGVDDQPTSDRRGIHQINYEFDDVQNPMSGQYFAVDGQRARADGNESGFRYRRDRHGEVFEVHFLDASGHLTLTKAGYALEKRRRDERGRVIERSYFGSSNEPILLVDDYAKSATQYDKHGRVVSTEYFGLSGARTGGPEGCSIVRIQRDNRGNEARRMCLGQSSEPILNNRGYSILSMHRNRFDELAKEVFLGVDGLPMDSLAGYARHVLVRSSDGRILKHEYFDVQNVAVVMMAFTLVGIRFRTAAAVGASSVSSDPRKPAQYERDQAEELGRALLDRVRRGMPLEIAALELKLEVTRARLPSNKVLQAIAALEVGATSDVIENGDSFVVVRREE